MRKQKELPKKKAAAPAPAQPENVTVASTDTPEVRNTFIAEWKRKTRQEKRQATTVIYGKKVRYLDYLARKAKEFPSITNTSENGGGEIDHRAELFKLFYEIGHYALIDYTAMIEKIKQNSLDLLNKAQEELTNEVTKRKSKVGTKAPRKPAAKKAAASKKPATPKKTAGARVVQHPAKSASDKQQKEGKPKRTSGK